MQIHKSFLIIHSRYWTQSFNAIIPPTSDYLVCCIFGMCEKWIFKLQLQIIFHPYHSISIQPNLSHVNNFFVISSTLDCYLLSFPFTSPFFSLHRSRFYFYIWACLLMLSTLINFTSARRGWESHEIFF